MSECACIYDGDGDGPEFSDTRWQKARVTHLCSECRREIQPGERYEITAGKWDGEFQTYRTCAECREIRGALFCEGWTYTQMWEKVGDHLDGGGSLWGCLRELETVKAKEKLVAFVRESIGLGATGVPLKGE